MYFTMFLFSLFIISCSSGGGGKSGKPHNGLKGTLLFDGAKTDHSRIASLIFRIENVSDEPIKFPESNWGIKSADLGVTFNRMMGGTDSGKSIMDFPLKTIDGTFYDLRPGGLLEILYEVILEPNQRVYMELCVNPSSVPDDYNGWTNLDKDTNDNDCVESNTLYLKKQG